MKSTKQIIYLFLIYFFIWSNLNAQESTQIFENGNDKLIIYSDVPGLHPSEFYRIRVRSQLTNNEWQNCFALITRSLWSEQVGGQEARHRKAYFDHLKDWSHTYTNIEMKGAVEIELSKANGDPINKAVVHPLAKGIATTIQDGKAYFAMEEPSLIAIDIDGQMDDQNTGAGYNGPPIHTLSVFASPIMDKPAPNGPGVKVVYPGEILPNPESYETLYFAPGIHNIGRNFTVQSFKKYYIPGDAFVLGTFTNEEEGNGKNIKIYGVGTISGDSIPHPQYDPEYPAEDSDPNIGTPWKPIGIKYAEYTEVEGVCVANPAFHAIYMAEKLSVKHTSVKWAKVLQWRINGDGIGNAHRTEDCFIRTQDDGCYIKGDKRRNVFWNDANCATFNLAGMPNKSEYSLLIEDNDVLYARNLRGKWVGSRVFSFRAVGQCNNVDVTFNNIRIEDKYVTLGVYQLFASADNSCMGNNSQSGGGINGDLKFKNIRAASRSTTGYSDIIWGREGHLMSGFTFQNVVIDGKVIKSLDDIGCYNEYVQDMTFNPDGISGDATLKGVKVRGEYIPEFNPDKYFYNIVLAPGTQNVPNVKAVPGHDGAGAETTHAKAIPGSTTIKVIAADNITTKTYTLNFSTTSDTVEVSSVFVYNCPSDSIMVGNKKQLSATIYPDSATNRTVGWSSSNTTIATIDSLTGLLTAIAPGKATITVTANDGGYTDECEVEVSKAPVSVSGVSISDCPFGIHQAGDKFLLTAAVFPEDAADKSVTWSSSKTSVATVNENGLVDTHSAGNTVIRVTTDDIGFYDECIVLVDDSGTTDAKLIESNTGDIRVYPNPVSDKLFLDFSTSGFKKEITIYNTLGQLLLAKTTNKNHFEIDVSDFIQNKILLVGVLFGNTADFFKVITI